MEEEDYLNEEEDRLYYALIAGDDSTLNRLLDEYDEKRLLNFKFKGQNQWGKSALHLCSETGNIDTAKLLITRGAKVNIQDNWQQTPLMYAVFTERLDMVKLLLTHSTAGIDHKDRFGKTALHFAVNNTETECLQEILDRGADADVMDDKGRSPLMYSVMQDGHLDVLRCLISSGCDVNLDSIVDHMTPLQVAARYAKDDVLSYIDELLEAGANPNRFDNIGNSPLTIMVLRANVYPHTYYKEIDPEVVKLLLRKGLSPNLVSTCSGPTSHHFHGTALKKAVLCYNPSLIEILLQAGADPDIPDNDSATPLLHAAQVNGLKAGQILLRENCDMDILGNVKLERWSPPVALTPFKCAIIKGHWVFAKMLVYAGYDLRKESYLITNKHVPDLLMINSDFLCWLQEWLARPPELLALARVCCRKYLQCPLTQSVNSLIASPGLRRILLLEDILTESDDLKR